MLSDLGEAFRAWLEDHPKLAERTFFWSLLVSVTGLGLVVAMALAMLVFLAWGVSPQLAMLMGTLTLAFWLFSAALVFSLRNTDQAYSWKMKRWMRKAQEGDIQSQWRLVETYGAGRHGIRKDAPARAWWLRKLAEAGDPRAMVALAQILKDGDGLLRDKAQARVWLDRAAETGNSDALKLMAEWGHANPETPPASDAE